MSMSTDAFMRMGRALNGEDMVLAKHQRVLTPSPLLMERLQALHCSAGLLAEASPQIVATPEAAHGLEEALVEAMFACIARGAPQDTAASVRHSEVIPRFEAVLGANPDTALYMPDVCASIGVPGRLLRACCAELLGMGPKQYLHLRRMHLAHAALLRADPEVDSVTEIATRYGFWELGRFSVAYRALFRELPSTTLKLRFAGGPRPVKSSLPLPFAKSA
jgi:AraC-like DNA-binding protein